MHITKFGHSCLFIEEQGCHILLDPGVYSVLPETLPSIDVLLITHEHQDHLDLTSIKRIVTENPQIRIYSNETVVEVLKKETIEARALQHGETVTEKNIPIEAFGQQHALIHSSIPLIQNRGFLIADRLFYPGDALVLPNRPIELLAWPSFAPWMRIHEALDYAVAVKPKTCFPVHDGMLKNPAFLHPLIGKILSENDIEFKPLVPAERTEM